MNEKIFIFFRGGEFMDMEGFFIFLLGDNIE